MSLRTGLQVVGLLAVGSLVFTGLLAMGPIGWLVFIPMLLIGGYQVYRERPGRTGTEREHATLNYCPNCGSPIDLEGFDAIDDSGADEDGDWQVRYCSTCGAPLESFSPLGLSAGSDTSSVDERSETGADRSGTVTNCSDCGAPNDPNRMTCEHCGAEL